MDAILTKIEHFLSPIGVLLQKLIGDNLPPMTDSEIIFWEVVPLLTITLVLILRDVYRDHMAAKMANRGSNVEPNGQIKRYASKAELIEAYAAIRHKRRVASASLIGANGMQVSDLEVEIDLARSEVVYVGCQSAKDVGLPVATSAWYIKDFGYCPV